MYMHTLKDDIERVVSAFVLVLIIVIQGIIITIRITIPVTSSNAQVTHEGTAGVTEALKLVLLLLGVTLLLGFGCGGCCILGLLGTPFASFLLSVS